MPASATIRLDKWLWAARFFKTRSQATAAIHCSRVHVDGARAKPGREMRVGMLLRIQAGESVFEIRVVNLSDVRGPAPVAQQLYEETPESKAARAQQAEMRRQHAILLEDTHGRPTKKNRRAIVRFTRRNDLP